MGGGKKNGALLPGMFSQEGFLGDDARGAEEIARDDGAALQALGLSRVDAARRLGELTDRAIAGLGAPVRAGRWCLAAQEGMGFTVCPFGHPGAYGKGRITATGEGGLTLSWSPLSVHLLAEHGFLGGRGSPFRLEPDALAELLR